MGVSAGMATGAGRAEGSPADVELRARGPSGSTSGLTNTVGIWILTVCEPPSPARSAGHRPAPSCLGRGRAALLRAGLPRHLGGPGAADDAGYTRAPSTPTSSPRRTCSLRSMSAAWTAPCRTSRRPSLSARSDRGTRADHSGIRRQSAAPRTAGSPSSSSSGRTFCAMKSCASDSPGSTVDCSTSSSPRWSGQLPEPGRLYGRNRASWPPRVTRCGWACGSSA